MSYLSAVLPRSHHRIQKAGQIADFRGSETPPWRDKEKRRYAVYALVFSRGTRSWNGLDSCGLNEPDTRFAVKRV
jgi:hypothetical protein